MSYFQSFHFSIFSFLEAFFSQNAAFPEFCTLECLISKVFIFWFLAFKKFFFRKMLNLLISALCIFFFPFFLFCFFFFSKFFFLQHAAFPDFCTLECFISFSFFDF